MYHRPVKITLGKLEKKYEAEVFSASFIFQANEFELHSRNDRSGRNKTNLIANYIIFSAVHGYTSSVGKQIRTWTLKSDCTGTYPVVLDRSCMIFSKFYIFSVPSPLNKDNNCNYLLGWFWGSMSL